MVKSNSINTQINCYLSQPCNSDDTDVLVYWKEHRDTLPALVKMAQKYLAVPASSTPVERLFSNAGKVFKPDRCCHMDKNFESVMFIKCNDDTPK